MRRQREGDKTIANNFSLDIFCTADVCIFTMVGKAGKASFLVGNFCLGSRSKVVC